MTNREYYAQLLDQLAINLPLTPAQSEWYDYYTRRRSLMHWPGEQTEFDNEELTDPEEYFK